MFRRYHASRYRIGIRVRARTSYRARRGFQLKRRRRRLCVEWLRVRFFYLIRLCVSKWKLPFSRLTKLFTTKGKKAFGAGDSAAHKAGRVDFSNSDGRKSYASSTNDTPNSFYSEAISDCLEFIKLSSVSSADFHEIDLNHHVN